MYLSRRTFKVSQKAYTKLEKYLDKVEANLSGEVDKSEVMIDIKDRIAEHLTKYSGEITQKQIEEVLSKMGNIDEYKFDEKKADTGNSATKATKWLIIVFLLVAILGCGATSAAAVMLGKAPSYVFDRMFSWFEDQTEWMMEKFEKDSERIQENYEETTDDMMKNYEERSDEMYEDYKNQTDKMQEDFENRSDEIYEEIQQKKEELEK